MEEPTILDYVLDRLAFWRKPRIQIPPGPGSPDAPDGTELPLPPAPIADEVIKTPVATAPALAQGEQFFFPWRSLLALLLALVGQRSLEPSDQRTWIAGALFYTLAVGFALLAAWRNEWQVAPHQPQVKEGKFTVRVFPFLFGLLFSAAAFFAFKGNQFTALNISIWLVGIFLVVWAFWKRGFSVGEVLQRVMDRLQGMDGGLKIPGWTILLILAAGVVIFFRVYRINDVPPEMVSDHAEKLLDVWDVTHGQTSIFFPRNTGREALQMYLTAAIVLLFNTGYSFLSLKIGTVLAGLLTLPYIYLLGKEVGNRRVALLALLFAGIAYWPNVISRVGLRFPLYPLFVAPTLYYLVRGLRTSNRNDFILAGLALGIGLHGYTPIRILPFVVAAAVLLFVLHSQSKGARSQAAVGFVLIGLVSLVVFLPLLRYAFENPDMFAYRAFTRLGTEERALPGPAIQIFLGNLWRAMTMFAWDDGEIWVNSVTHRPALDVVSAVLLYLGMALLFFRYLRSRHWLDVFLLLSIPLLMMPSILSLAFPAENPALNRMGGAIVPVFIIIALALDGLMDAMQRGLGKLPGAAAGWLLAGLLFVVAANQNYDLVFRQYQQVFEQSSWNTSEMGEVIHDFAVSMGSADNAWVAAFPYWVDTRLVGINAGFPQRDFAIFPENFAATLSQSGSRLFLVKPEDTAGLAALQELYPQGNLSTYDSAVEGHDFYIFFVP